MPHKFSTIAFDADDTLWENEAFFRLTQDRFAQLLVDYTDPDTLAARLLAAERRNLGHYGFGIKGFVLSMIETAIEVTDEKVPATVIKELIDAGQDMLRHPIHLLDGVTETIEKLASDYDILMITKGDLLDQERKLAQSGLGDKFDGIEIVSAKDCATYRNIFTHRQIDPNSAMMVGNSMKSDVIAPIQAGAWGVFVPHNLTWAIEHAAPPVGHARFHELENLFGLPDLIHTLST
ncbi:putative hydrolase of the HAD superfamily [Pacificibacter maritimus]|uniref:Putative hydrolase of the HAD superfamily n=1 Tax=Pacificibacter maritimus TaxID=762213 RepID=A0A3N4UN74_9RHOB|nr:HAD family hydrolase [Pacificibacter maritimus]RPE66487.1 putative hydrolase of the HAD superfamily [Pacificibacter maritimus]